MTKNIREQVVNLLLEIERDKSYAQLALKNELKNVTGPDKGFMTEVVYGTLKYQIKLDYIINQFSKIPVRKMKPLIRVLFRMSAYQLMCLDKVPTSAVINEAVKIAKKRKFVALSGFVNGVLRTIDRERENIKYPSKEKETVHYMSVMYSLPEWMIETWLKSYDMAKVEAICNALNERAQVCIRVNTLKASKEEVIKKT
ncbi:transcription antitermination factor NusB [Cellulosilyticum ruminicola]|uniref:transcription antitermination factor NusB n=1 Tax=Cellulosilyticum ruminicola TaxID=425254 RepID=UPI0006D11EA6|nr:transcription antitermination factor NusB [Cellulosilyticum ruminicola]